jgi:DNA-binding transcriptional regulator YiaG
MANIESTIKSEIERLTKKQLKKTVTPLRKALVALKKEISALRKALQAAEKASRIQAKEAPAVRVIPTPVPLSVEPAPEKGRKAKAKTRVNPMMIQALRKKLGLTQKELAALAGVSMGAVQLWEKGKIQPRDEKKAVLAGLRKMKKNDVKKALEGKGK